MSEIMRPDPTHLLTVRHTVGMDSTQRLWLTGPDGKPLDQINMGDAALVVSHGGDNLRADRTYYNRQYMVSYRLMPWEDVKRQLAEIKRLREGDRAARESAQ